MAHFHAAILLPPILKSTKAYSQFSADRFNRTSRLICLYGLNYLALTKFCFLHNRIKLLIFKLSYFNVSLHSDSAQHRIQIRSCRPIEFLFIGISTFLIHKGFFYNFFAFINFRFCQTLKNSDNSCFVNCPNLVNCYHSHFSVMFY